MLVYWLGIATTENRPQRVIDKHKGSLFHVSIDQGDPRLEFKGGEWGQGHPPGSQRLQLVAATSSLKQLPNSCWGITIR